MNPTAQTERLTGIQAGLKRAAEFPVLDAIFGRRSRRFALGAELTGPLAFKSQKPPLPLDPAEEAVLVAAATGVTGVANDEWPFTDWKRARTGADKLTSYTGRTYQSPLATHGTEIFWTNDEGVFVLPQRDAAPTERKQLQDHESRSALYEQAIKLQDGRLKIPIATPNLFELNHWIVNKPGTTLFIPVADLTRQAISAMLLYFDDPHRYYIADKQLGGDPLRPLVRSGWFSANKVNDLWDFERWQMVDINGVEHGIVIQNLALATQALGLGGHPFSGGKGRVTFGGTPLWHDAGGHGEAGSLGFTFHQVPEGAPFGAGERIPVGLPGIFEGYVPPFYNSMSDAVDAVVDLRWGPDGIFDRDNGKTVPWREPLARYSVPRPAAEAIEATKLLSEYIWSTYGRFPATIDPFLTTVWYQAQHLDIDFYDRYYPDDALPENVREHLALWHPEYEADGE
jgi:hypothetical protein